MADKRTTISNAETIDAPISAVNNGAVSSGGLRGLFTSIGESTAVLRAASRRRVAIVEGSTPHLSTDFQDLLRGRLRTVGLLFFGGFLVFFLWSLIWLSWRQENEPWGVFWMHLGVTILLGVVSAGLCRRCPISQTKLYWSEAVIIGAPALFFVVLNYHQLEYCCELPGDRAFVRNSLYPWIIMILTYAIFIPTHWKAALGVLAPLAIAPVAVLYYMRFASPSLAELLEREEFKSLLVQQPLVMGMTLVAAIVGVWTINSLRREAFEAKQLGQYRLKELLGSGGMGEVYLAEHQMMKRPCAVKLIRPEKAGDPRTLARFEREVRTTAKLSHWNSIDVYDYGRTNDGTFYYVMEYLPGHNIGELVEQHGPLPPARIVYLLKQVCAALSEAHSIGLVHRDIKPANLFSAYRGGMFDVAKLLDFGLAKPVFATQDIALTQDGAVTGSPLYMSPEQVNADEDADARSDIYSLGAVMYYMLTGSPPFVRKKPLQIMIAHASEPLVPPSDLNPDIPHDLELIVLRCLEKSPEDRYQSVRDLARDLEHAEFDGEWDSESAADWWECKGCPKRKAMAAAAMEAAAV